MAGEVTGEGVRMRFVLAGNERIGCECLRTLLRENQQVVGVITDLPNSRSKLENKRLKHLAHQSGIRVYEIADINDPGFLGELRLLAPDVLFNIAFLHLYKAPVLGIPASGCINFHPGPLPKYGGMNGWVWAIINGESEYGVAFHYMKEQIDAGDIIGRERFSIEQEETGLSLLMKCYDRGIALFGNVLRDILENHVAPVAQDMGERSYYYNRVPFGGLIDTQWHAAKICDFVRAMNFTPFPNPLSPPMIAHGSTRLVVAKAEVLPDTGDHGCIPGEVVELKPEGVVMKAGNGVIMLTLSNISGPSADTAGVCATSGIVRGSILGC